MVVKNWDSIETKKGDDLPENFWTLGYFYSSHDNWDGKTWVRNLHELQIRDLALFSLGDVKNKKVLDIGCGSGIYMDIISRIEGIVYGQDISQECVNNCICFFKKRGIDAVVKCGNATSLLFEDNYFDKVFAADFFEHLTYKEKNQVVSEVYRVLKPGGFLTIKTPNLEYLKLSLFIKRISAIFRLKNPFNIYLAHTHNNPNNEHCGLTTYTELGKILTDGMFHLPKVTYIPLVRKKLPMFITKFLYGKKKFTESIIITTRKPLFYGFYPK